jgi:hypothetical protein
MAWPSPGAPELPARARLAGVRVMTWNLWWRFGDWAARRPAILAVTVGLRNDLTVGRVQSVRLAAIAPVNGVWAGDHGVVGPELCKQ